MTNIILPGDIGFSQIAMPGKITVAAGQLAMGDGCRYEHVRLGLTGMQFGEARPPKAQIVDFDQSKHGETLWFRLPLTPSQRELIDRTARQELSEGTIKYAWSAYANIGLLKWGIRPQFIKNHVEKSRRKICSQYADRYLTLAGFDVLHNVLPGEVTPGDLYYRISQDPESIPFRVDGLPPYTWRG